MKPPSSQSAEASTNKANTHPYDAVSSIEHQHGRGTSHVHSAASQKRLINRLSRIEGHVRGIKGMVQDNRACPDVLTQIAAVRGALDGIARLVLHEHFSECITRAHNEGSLETELESLKAALDRFI